MNIDCKDSEAHDLAVIIWDGSSGAHAQAWIKGCVICSLGPSAR